MQIKISYPLDFPLSGWDRAIFGIRVAHMFNKKWVDICTLDACRNAAGLAPEKDALRNDLHALHCVRFGEMPHEVLDELPKRIGQYIGVTLTKRSRPRMATGLRILGVAVMLAAIGFAVTAFVDAAEAERHSVARRQFSTAEAATPSLLPPPFAPSSARDAASSGPVFSASFSTSTPQKSLHRIASAIALTGGKYDVSVTVTPSTGEP